MVSVSCTVPRRAPGRISVPGLQAVVGSNGHSRLRSSESHVQAARNVVAGHLGDLVQRSLHAVEDALQQPRAELDRQRVAKPSDRLAGAQSLGRFVGLHDGIVAFERDDLADDVQAADAHLFAVAPARAGECAGWGR